MRSSTNLSRVTSTHGASNRCSTAHWPGDGGQMSGDYPLLRCTGMQL
jgi:hypothetical protein